jgi:hypothetical protein
MNAMIRWLVLLSAIAIAAGCALALFHLSFTAPNADKQTGLKDSVNEPKITMPQVGNSLAADMLSNTNATRMWFGYTTLPNKPLLAARTSANWRIVGSTTVANVTAVLILFEGSPTPIAVVAGTPLPGGALLVGVNENAAIINQQGRVMELPFSF